MKRCNRFINIFLNTSGACIPQRGLESSCNSDIECDESKMLSCINKKCNCRAGYFKTSKGLCGLDYNQECSKEKVCSDEFSCTQYALNVPIYRAICLCPNIELEFYDGTTCIGVVGGPCKRENGCPENAHCVPVGDSDRVCKCQEGFIEYDRKNCDIVHGSLCDPQNGWSLH